MSWRVSGNLKVLTADIKSIFGKVTVYSIGDTAHQHSPSDHNPDSRGVVCAIDIMMNVSSKTNSIVKALIGRSDLAYVIHNRTIWSASYGWRARKYTGSDPHTNHIHVSSKHTAAADQCRTHLKIGAPSPVKPPSARSKFVLPAWNKGKNDYFRPYLNSKPPIYATIKNVQRKLYSIGYSITADGMFGAGTYSVIKDFQKKNHLVVDGKIGPATYAKLRSR